MGQTALTSKVNDDDPNRYMDEREVARRSSFSTRQLQLMRHRGDGPPWFKIGQRVLYKWADVEAWIRTHRGRGNGEGPAGDQEAGDA